MKKHHTFDGGLKYRPDYEWPDSGAVRKCPKCEHPLELIENKPTYFGKPWWCHKCQWQFSEDDFPDMDCESQDHNSSTQ